MPITLCKLNHEFRALKTTRWHIAYNFIVKKVLAIPNFARNGMLVVANDPPLIKLLEFAACDEWANVHHWRVGDPVMYDIR